MLLLFGQFTLLSEQDQKQLEAIADKYAPDKKRLLKKVLEEDRAQADPNHENTQLWREQKSTDAQIAVAVHDVGASPARRREIISELAALNDQIEEEQHAFWLQCEERRLGQIGSAAGILEDAKERSLEYLRIAKEEERHALRTWTPDAVKELGVGIIIDDQLVLSADYAGYYLKAMFEPYFKALPEQEDAAALYSLIIAAIEESPDVHKDGPIKIETITGTPAAIQRSRRNPLAPIRTYGLLNDNASTQLMQDGEEYMPALDGQIHMRWPVYEGTKKDTPVNTYIALSYEGTQLSSIKRLTGFDIAVYNAVATRFYYWRRSGESMPLQITPDEIWRTMNGKQSGDGNAKPSPAQLQRVCRSMDKMRFTRVYMDVGEEIKAFDLKIDDERVTGGRIDTYLLESSAITFETEKGKTVTGYRITSEPILYTYSAAKKRILYVPYEMLDTSAGTSTSENVVEFRNYLLKQIQLMKNAAKKAAEEGKKSGYFKRSNIILIETIYKETGITPPEERVEGRELKSEKGRQKQVRRFRQADTEKIEGILSVWKDKGWITDYVPLDGKGQPVKKNQTTKAYSITL